MRSLIDSVKQIYTHFDAKVLDSLAEIYSPDIVFIDPFQQLAGLESLKAYYTGLAASVDDCQFEFRHHIEQINGDGVGEAVLFWIMHYSHPRLAQGRRLSLNGNSHLRFDQKIIYHRDYFDAGALLYEHIPLLGGVIRQLKRRMEK